MDPELKLLGIRIFALSLKRFAELQVLKRQEVEEHARTIAGGSQPMKRSFALVALLSLAAPLDAGQSTFTLHVDPPDAEVVISNGAGSATIPVGSFPRKYTTPDLREDREYFYTFTVSKGSRKNTKQVDFRGGENVSVTLSAFADDMPDKGLKEGDVFVPKELRPRNYGPKCVWCAVQTCFYGAAGLEEFNGIRDRAITSWQGGADRPHVIAYLESWEREGRSGGVKLRQGKGYEFFRQACEANTGAVFFIPGHALYLCGIDETSARVIDNNGPPVVQEWPRAKFDRMAEWGCFPDIPWLNRPGPGPGPQPEPRPGPRPNHPPLNPNKPLPPTPKPDGTQPPVEPKPAEPVKPTPPAIDLDKLAELIAAKLPKPKDGKDGKPGADGEPGPAGPEGKPGAIGPAGTIPSDLILAEINRVLANTEFRAELYDTAGNLKEVTTFGPSKPLKIKLVPVKVAAPN